MTAKEQEILQAAEEEFFLNGYDATSTAVIAKRIGVTHAMVNYYFRTKEQLFLKVLDGCIGELLMKIKSLMKADGGFVELVEETAATLFDCFNTKRQLPFLILDIARTHPEFLSGYRETVQTTCAESVRRHSAILAEMIDKGLVADCRMNDVFDSILSLAVAPFLSVPMLRNVMGLDDDGVEAYLASHRAEMLLLIRARYTGRA